MTGYGLGIFPQHAKMLAASGITPEHAAARGYRSVDTRARLEQIGVTKDGRRVPGLLVPQLRADGTCWGYQYRPDNPRTRERAGSKPQVVKYETPTGQANGIDVPPGVRPMLGDPAVPLWITEGVKKADCGAIHGLCIVALPGVWSWRGRNDKGGKVAVSDWHDVALNDRRVVLAFDGDVSRKRSVRAALDQLAGYLTSKGAKVEYLHLPDEADKVGLDDFLTRKGATVADLLRLVRPEPPAVAEAEPVQPVQPVQPVSGRGSQEPAASLNVRKSADRRCLADVKEWLSRFIVTMHEDDLDLLALWAAHTHLCVETYTTPRLVLDSPVPGSGKTTVLEHLERLCLAPVQMAVLSSPALLTRMLDAGLRTILIDEADRSLNPDKDGVADLLAVLNSGYKRGASRPVLVPTKENGWQAKEMPTFAPVVMAGNNPNLPEDTKSRAIRVLLMPDRDGSAEESDWELYDEHARELGGRLAAWAETVRDQVRTNRPELPEAVRGRARERWAPLKRVAVAAGGRWPEVVDALAVKDVQRIELEREEGIVRERPAVALLRHIHDAIGMETFIPTEQLLERLVWAEPDMWGAGSPFGKPLTAQRLGRMLVSAYDIHSDRLSATGPRGYLRSTLAPAFRRFGLDPSGEPAQPAQPAEPAQAATNVRAFTPPTGPGRCPSCGWHIATQGHRDTCEEKSA